MTSQHDSDSIDDAIRRLHAAPLDADSERMATSLERSFLASRPSSSPPVPRRRRPHRVAVLATTALAGAIAALVAVGLLPNGDPGHDVGGLHRLGASATAAEVLEEAQSLVLASGSTAGSGDVWHGITRAFHGGELVSINEQWYDTSSDENLLAAWGRDRSDDQFPSHYAPWDADDHPIRAERLLIDRVDEDGYQRLRRFERPEGAGWAFPPGDLDPTRAMDRPIAPGDRQRQLAHAMSAWLEAASPRRATTADLRRATQAFMRSTPDYFSAQPEFAVSSAPGGVHTATKTEMANFDSLRDAVPIRQIVYLLTTVRATPRATAALYELIGGFDSLERLGDVTIDGRAAMRLRFDQSDPTIAPTRERVLVLDAATGAIVRTETLDRTAWTRIEPARRVDAIGAAAELCRGDIQVPCDLLDGHGDIARIADTFATDMAVRYAAHSENRTNKRRLGAAAPPLLCTKMSELGRCEPQGPEEARRLRAIASDSTLLARSIRPSDAFATSELLVSLTDTDGAVRMQGQCFRDWRFLAICRG